MDYNKFKNYIKVRQGRISIPDIQMIFGCKYQETKEAFERAVSEGLLVYRDGMLYEINNKSKQPKARGRLRSDGAIMNKREPPQNKKEEVKDSLKEIKDFIIKKNAITIPQLQNEFILDYSSAYKIIKQLVERGFLEYNNGLEYKVSAEVIKKAEEDALIAERRAYLEQKRRELIQRFGLKKDTNEEDDDNEYHNLFEDEEDDDEDDVDEEDDDDDEDEEGNIKSWQSFYARRYMRKDGKWRTISDFYDEMHKNDNDSDEEDKEDKEEDDKKNDKQSNVNPRQKFFPKRNREKDEKKRTIDELYDEIHKLCGYTKDNEDDEKDKLTSDNEYLNADGEDYDSVKYRLLEEECNRQRGINIFIAYAKDASENKEDTKEDAVSRLTEALNNINPAEKLTETLKKVNPIARLSDALNKITEKKDYEQRLLIARNDLVSVLKNLSAAQDDDRRLSEGGKYSVEYAKAIGGADIMRHSDGRFKITFKNINVAEKMPFSVFLLYEGNKTYLSDNKTTYYTLGCRIGETRAINKIVKHVSDKPWIECRNNELFVPTSIPTAVQDIYNMYFAQRSLLENF